MYGVSASISDRVHVLNFTSEGYGIFNFSKFYIGPKNPLRYNDYIN